MRPEPSEAEYVLMITKTFLAEILLIKSCINSIVTSHAINIKLNLNLKDGH